MKQRLEYDSVRERIEEELSRCFVENCPQGELLEAMRYSLLAGGKRVRPVLVVKFCEACGGDPELAIPAALAIEMLHTYSLIHDDLPCMDNDALRRGRPTCHIVYGETNAVLAGDALQAAAFRTILQSPCRPDVTVKMASILAEASGENGMCGGQYLDMCSDPMTDRDALSLLQSLKTGALLEAACLIGAVCGGADESQFAAAQEYARCIGAAFQIRDDVLDVTATTEEIGKPSGSDANNGKQTFATLLGLEECEKLIDTYTCAAQTAVAEAFERPEFLVWLARELSYRKK